MSDEEKRNYSKEYQEMIQIEEGLERFLEQELQDMKEGLQISQNSRSVYRESNIQNIEIKNEDMGEEKPYQEIATEENNMAGTGRKKSNKQSRTLQDDYLEDWDQFTGHKSAKKRSSANRSSTSRNSADRNAAKHSSPSRSSSSRNSANHSSSTGSSSNHGSSGRSSSAKSQKNAAKKHKKMHFKRFLITVALLIALFGIAHYCLVASIYSKLNYKAIETESIANAPLKEDGVINILLIGNDSRQNGEDGRSDAMILLSISSKTKKIYMTSLLRDMYVDIPGRDGNRLNAAYSFGGAELLMKTVEQNLDIHINRYMLVNFEAFANLVEAVGGVELELSSEEVAYVNGYLNEYNILTNRPEGTDYMDTSLNGMLHLNGPQALAYTRNRYLGTDFGRTERQRKVLSAVIKKLPKAAVTNSKELMNGLLPNLTTNLTQSECYQLSFYAPKLLTYEIVQNSIPLEGTYKNSSIRGMAVLEVDFEANKKYIQENIYGK